MSKIFLLIFISLLLTSCQSAKDALTLKKKPSGDEFLVEKKSPLAMPPDFGKLPVPKEKENNENLKDENEIQVILFNKDSNFSSQIKKRTDTKSLEKSILEKIQ